MGARRGSILNLNQTILIVVQCLQIGTVDRMNRQPTPLVMYPKMRSPGNGIAAARELHKQIARTLDLHALVVGPTGGPAFAASACPAQRAECLPEQEGRSYS